MHTFPQQCVIWKIVFSLKNQSIMSAWYYHVCVILCITLHFSHVFDTVKSICERCSPCNLANADISSTMCDFENCFFLKKSKYHVCVILSRLRDTWPSITFKVSHRRDSITQTWYFEFLRKKLFSKSHIVEEMSAFAKLQREHLSQILFTVSKTWLKWSITQTWFAPNWGS